MKSLTRYFLGFGFGILIATALAMLTVNMAPYHISEYIPIFIGAFIASYIIKNRPVTVGVLLSILMMAISILNLLVVIFSTTKSLHVHDVSFQIIISIILYLPFGLLGGYCASLIRKQRNDALSR